MISDPLRARSVPVALIGGIHLDRIAHAARPILPDTSTPGRIETRPGGVAANVATVLARLGGDARPVGRLGRDADGDALRKRLQAMGIDISAIRTGAAATASYLALHEPDGRLTAAVVDTAITEEIGAADVSPLPRSLSEAAIWFVDANLTPATLAEIARLAERRGRGPLLVADAVSIAKAGRLAGVIERLDLVFANMAEAGELTGETSPIETLAEALVERGCAAAIVTDGEQGCALARADGETVPLPALPARIVDVTGAGDALTGGALAGLAAGLDLRASLDYGRAAAALTLEATGAAPDSLSLDAIRGRLGESEKGRAGGNPGLETEAP